MMPRTRRETAETAETADTAEAATTTAGAATTEATGTATAEDTTAPTTAPEDTGVTVAQTGDRLQAVQDAGVVRCGSRDELPGFNFLDASGEHVGFDADFCRAIAAAVLGDADGRRIRRSRRRRPLHGAAVR